MNFQFEEDGDRFLFSGKLKPAGSRWWVLRDMRRLYDGKNPIIGRIERAVRNDDTGWSWRSCGRGGFEIELHAAKTAVLRVAEAGAKDIVYPLEESNAGVF